MYLWKTYRVVQGCFSIAQRCALETLKDNAEKESLLHPTPSRKLRAEKFSASPLRKQTTRKSQRQPRRIAAPTQWRRRWAGSMALLQTHLARGKPLRGQHREKPVPRPVSNYGETESNSAVTACSRGGAVRANDSIASRRSRGKRASTSAAPSS